LFYSYSKRLNSHCKKKQFIEFLTVKKIGDQIILNMIHEIGKESIEDSNYLFVLPKRAIKKIDSYIGLRFSARGFWNVWC